MLCTKWSEMMWVSSVVRGLVSHPSCGHPVVKMMWETFFSRHWVCLFAYRNDRRPQRSTTGRSGSSAPSQIWMTGTNRLEGGNVCLRAKEAVQPPGAHHVYLSWLLFFWHFLCRAFSVLMKNNHSEKGANCSSKCEKKLKYNFQEICDNYSADNPIHVNGLGL